VKNRKKLNLASYAVIEFLPNSPGGFMFAVLLPVIAMLFYLGIETVELTMTLGQHPSAEVTIAETQVTDFLLYKDALQNFIEDNPTFNGEVPATDLLLPVGIALPNAIGNNVGPADGGGDFIEAWYVPTGTISASQAQTLSTQMVDGTIGTAVGGLFHAYNGGLAQPLPFSPPNNAVVFYDIQNSNSR
jgi:hypothetical protein